MKRTQGFAERTKEYAELLIPVIREVARRHGYALAVHGSLAYDIDLVAIPWVDPSVKGHPTDAKSLADAVENLCHAVTGMKIEHSDKGPTIKPHGRVAWSFHLGGGPYIDISIMPRLDKKGKLLK